MTKEKELGIFIAEMVNGLPDSGDNFKDCFTLAKAIIQRYPQITKKPVKIELYKGIIDHSIFMPCVAIAHHDDAPQFNSTGENGRQKWLDEHYVEVVG